MNHIYGNDIVSPNGENTHHKESNVSWENITLWVNWLILTECIYNSWEANTFSRARLDPYLQQHQKENSYNSIYGVHIGTALFTFKAKRVCMKGFSTMAACTSAHKNSILIHNTGEHKCTSVKLEMASGKKQNHTLPQAKREIKESKWRTQ